MLFFVLIIFVTGCSLNNDEEEPPDLTVHINDKSMEAMVGAYTWETEGLFSNKAVVVDALAPFQIAEDMKSEKVESEQKVTLSFSNKKIPELDAYLWEGKSRNEQLEVKQDQIVLPSEQGKHIIEVMTRWANGEASYTFVVERK